MHGLHCLTGFSFGILSLNTVCIFVVWMPGPIKKSAQAAARIYAIQEGNLSNMRPRTILPLQKVPGRS